MNQPFNPTQVRVVLPQSFLLNIHLSSMGHLLSTLHPSCLMGG